MVHGTVVQEARQRRGRNPTIQTLGDKSWDSTEEILGQCSLGTVLEQCSLGLISLFLKFFLSKFLRFGENLLLVFERTGDHKIPAKKLGFKLPEATKGR